MTESISITDTHIESPPLTTSRPTAAEDVRVSSYVAVLRTSCEIPSFLWGADIAVLPPEQPIRYQHIPCDSGTPMKVKSVCIPFVFVELPTGRHATLDLRRCEVATLSPDYAEVAWKELNSRKRHKHRKRSKKNRSL